MILPAPKSIPLSREKQILPGEYPVKSYWPIVSTGLGMVALGAHAQNCVTLYGLFDTGLGYLNNLSPEPPAWRPRPAINRST
jgi:hypothetical protein